MNNNSGKDNNLPQNADVQEEFIKVIKNPNSYSYWIQYISMRLYYSIIPHYENKCTADDIMSQLKLKIFDDGKIWDRTVYPTFKKFMYGQINNIMRNVERDLTREYEPKNGDKVELISYNEEELNIEEMISVRPRARRKDSIKHTEMNLDLIGSEYLDPDDKFAHYGNTFNKQFDNKRFHETVIVILERRKDKRLVNVYSDYMADVEKSDILTRYFLTDQDYWNIWKRIKYVLEKELPKSYRNMLSSSIFAFILLWQLQRVARTTFLN
jgi:hypothetical protein